MLNAGKENGLTLVEVLVALTVTALMLTAVYQTVGSASRAREKLALENGKYHVARIIIERIGRELQSLHFVANDGRSRFSGGVGGGDMDVLSFTTTASTPLAREPGLPARVVYRLEVGTGDDIDTYRLTRTESGSLTIDRGHAYKLADQLTDVEVRFLNNGDWLNRWDSQARQGLPEAVSLTFATRVGTSEEVFRTIWQIGE